MARRRDGSRCTTVILGVAASVGISCGGRSPSSPGTPAPTPTVAPTPVVCNEPLPPPIGQFRVTVHLKSGLYWTLDSTPLVSDAAYCRAIGFTDGRATCPVRPEGHPERLACEEKVVGKAADTGRVGPTWTRNGNLCTGIDSGCDNDPENQFQLLVYWQGQGDYKACAESGVCGTVFARGPAFSE